MQLLILLSRLLLERERLCEKKEKEKLIFSVSLPFSFSFIKQIKTIRPLNGMNRKEEEKLKNSNSRARR